MVSGSLQRCCRGMSLFLIETGTLPNGPPGTSSARPATDTGPPGSQGEAGRAPGWGRQQEETTSRKILDIVAFCIEPTLGATEPSFAPETGELRQKIEELQDCISKLSAASLRISASLDIGTVLREVVESARALMGDRFGGVATIDDSGQVQEFATSGFTSEENRQLEAWPDGPPVIIS